LRGTNVVAKPTTQMEIFWGGDRGPHGGLCPACVIEEPDDPPWDYDAVIGCASWVILVTSPRKGRLESSTDRNLYYKVFRTASPDQLSEIKHRLQTQKTLRARSCESQPCHKAMLKAGRLRSWSCFVLARIHAPALTNIRAMASTIGYRHIGAVIWLWPWSIVERHRMYLPKTGGARGVGRIFTRTHVHYLCNLEFTTTFSSLAWSKGAIAQASKPWQVASS
jgi:hypothetical protein